MKINSYRNLIICIIGAAILATACLPDAEPGIPRRTSLLFNVVNTGDSIVKGQDTVVVSEVKLLLDRFNLIAVNTTLQTSTEPLILEFSESDIGRDVAILQGNIGFTDVEEFIGLKIFIDKTELNDPILDDDLAGGFSISVEGTYNGIPFDYQSDTVFERELNFNNVTLTDERETLVVRLVTSISSWMVDPSTNTVIDPFEESNSAKIDSLLERSFTVEAFANNSLPFN